MTQNTHPDTYDWMGRDRLEREPQQGIFVTSTEEDVKQGILRATIRPDPILFYGKTAGEMRRAGWANPDPSVPDCAKFGPNGFEWVEVDFTYKAKMS